MEHNVPMHIYRDHKSVPVLGRGAAVAIGNFDGVHRGHRMVLGAAHALAEQRNVPLGIVTFEPHPREVIQPKMAPPRLTTFRRKARLLAELAVDRIYALRFDAAMMRLSAEAFVRDLLVHELGVAAVVTGDSFRFGHERRGDAALMRTILSSYGLPFEAVPPLEIEGMRCSSSRIRDLLAAGDVEAAANLLGAPYVVEGLVCGGDQRGRTIGFPTANVHPLGPKTLMPGRGVYAVEAVLDGGPNMAAVANLGTRPTFDGRTTLLEVHVLDRTVELYGKRLGVRFLSRLRGERKFEGIEQLKEQISRDCDKARIIFGVAPRIQSPRAANAA